MGDKGGQKDKDKSRKQRGMSQQLLKFEAAALHWSCYTTGDETEVQASQ